jgi:5-keto 4-deoxyuronate isomerase
MKPSGVPGTWSGDASGRQAAAGAKNVPLRSMFAALDKFERDSRKARIIVGNLPACVVGGSTPSAGSIAKVGIASMLVAAAVMLSGCAVPVVNIGGTTNVVIVQKYNRDGTMTSTTDATENNPMTNDWKATVTP